MVIFVKVLISVNNLHYYDCASGISNNKAFIWCGSSPSCFVTKALEKQTLPTLPSVMLEAMPQ